MAGRVFKRGETYHIAFFSNGVEYRKSALTNKKREAEKLLAFYLGQCARGEFQGFTSPPPALSLAEVLEDFAAQCQERGLRGMDRIRSHLKQVATFLGPVAAADIDERRIDHYRKHRLAHGVARATINRETQYLTQALQGAVEKKLLPRVPVVKKYAEHNARQGFFEIDECERVVRYLPDDLQDFVRFAYHSGWRRGEIAHLEWRDVEEEVIRLRPEFSKTGEGRVLGLVGEIAAIMARRRAVATPDAPWVFYRSRRGRLWPVGRFDKVWRKACAAAGVPGRLVHDFRRSAVRNMTRAGVPEKIAMTISGHKTRAIFDRYNITNEADIRQAQTRTQAYLSERRTAEIPEHGHQTDTTPKA